MVKYSDYLPLKTNKMGTMLAYFRHAGLPKGLKHCTFLISLVDAVLETPRSPYKSISSSDAIIL
jgi:hypothetical protein